MKKLNLFLAVTAFASALNLSGLALATSTATAIYRCGGYASGEAFVGTISLSPQAAQVSWSMAIGPRAVNPEGKWASFGPFINVPSRTFMIFVSPDMLQRSKRGGVVVVDTISKEKTTLGCRLAQ